MSTTHDLRWGRATLRTERLDNVTRRTTQTEPTIELYAYTKTDQARRIELTEKEALQLAHGLLGMLIKAPQIRLDRARRRGDALDGCDESTTCGSNRHTEHCLSRR